MQTLAVSRAAEPTGARALRFEQAIVTIALLTGFVFGVPWVVLVVTVLMVGAVFGRRTNIFVRAYDYLFFGPASADRPNEPAATTRLTRGVELGLLVLAAILVLVGAEGFAWVFALLVVAITGLAATTMINLVAVVHDRTRR
jgi:hypothetical protein